MPYASEAQRKYMHAIHPKIAAKWDAEGREHRKSTKPKKKTKVKKRGGKLKAVSQQVIDQTTTASSAADRRKRGRVRKAYVPTSTDPYFNQAAAEKAFNLVMKMDDASAEMFTTMVVGELYERDLENNLPVLQRHLNEVIAKRLEMAKQATLRTIAKSDNEDEALVYAAAIDIVSQHISKADDDKWKGIGAAQRFGYQWKESDFHRDPSSGRFMVKISHNQQHLMSDGASKTVLGTSTPDKHGDARLSHADRIKFQDEYRQVADFLGMVQQSSSQPGDMSVLMHFRDRAGRHSTDISAGTKPPKDALTNPDLQLVGIEARPTNLNAGGAAFGLATAMGGTMNRRQLDAINTVDRNSKEFTNTWLQAGSQEPQASNQRLYDRMQAGGNFLGQIAPGTKFELAGKLASIVGQHGPEAEAVLGPTARKTAYRYRGTEKRPDAALVAAYDRGIREGKHYGDLSEDQIETFAGRGQARGVRRVATPDIPPAITQLRNAAQRRTEAERAPTWGERDKGRQEVIAFLSQPRVREGRGGRAPRKSLYELHLASGHTPPSEGVILNADGQIVTQAVGYGDDHYLPFNLRNLAGLKGGEYIRSRSVGGLTAEDVYTGLVSGARQVTVTSRSGTYVMTFEPDFRGGRRYNDKARRMTRRYEELVDAIQSSQVERQDIDEDMRKEIEREVKAEMPMARRPDILAAVKERVDEFKEDPYISEKDEERAEAIIAYQTAGLGDSARDEAARKEVRNQIYDRMMDQKETKFRLNSAGYKAGLEALQEQFPYYIQDVRWIPPRDQNKMIATERDKGYVEPSRIRPTAAAAGLYGVQHQEKYITGTKFSARDADYAGKRKAGGTVFQGGTLRPLGDVTPENDITSGRLVSNTPTTRDLIADRKADQVKEDEVVRVAMELKKEMELIDAKQWETYPGAAEALTYTAADLRDPVKRGKFDYAARVYFGAAESAGRNIIGLKQSWERAIAATTRKKYEKDKLNHLVWGQAPFKFEGPDEPKAYRSGADSPTAQAEMRKLDRDSIAAVHDGTKQLSQLDEKGLMDEFDALRQMSDLVEMTKGKPLRTDDLPFTVDKGSAGVTKDLRSNPKEVAKRMEMVQRMRALLMDHPEAAASMREARPAVDPDVVVTRNAPGAGTSVETGKDPIKALRDELMIASGLRKKLEDRTPSNEAEAAEQAADFRQISSYEGMLQGFVSSVPIDDPEENERWLLSLDTPETNAQRRHLRELSQKWADRDSVTP